MKLHVERQEEEIVATSSLLRFNILSRRSTILNSKGSKNEKAMEYLMAEFDKMEINLDRMLCAQQTGEAQNDQQGNEEGQTIAAQAGDPQTEIDDPERIQRKGRPPKPVRMKTHIEEIKKKLVAAEKKKTNDIDNAGKKFEYIKIEFQYIQIEFESKCKNSYLCELIMFCRLPGEAKKKEEEGNIKW